MLQLIQQKNQQQNQMVRKPQRKKKKAEAPKGRNSKKAEAPKATEIKTYAAVAKSSAAKKILAEKGMQASTVSGTGKDGRVTKEDALKAVPSMGTPTGGARGTLQK